MRKRYRLKLSVPSVGGIVGSVLRLFPNALTFVGYPTAEQLLLLAEATAFLDAFGVSAEVLEG